MTAAEDLLGGKIRDAATASALSVDAPALRADHHRVLALAVYPLRQIAASPLPRGFMPRTGKPKAFSYLYPAEDAKLMWSGVALQDRLLFGFLAREGARAVEATSLPIAAFDLVRGAVRLDENKTDDPRTWALDPGVVRGCKRTSSGTASPRKPTDLMFVDANGDPYPSKLARRFRSALKRAKVDRAELHDSTEARGRIRVHHGPKIGSGQRLASNGNIPDRRDDRVAEGA